MSDRTLSQPQQEIPAGHLPEDRSERNPPQGGRQVAWHDGDHVNVRTLPRPAYSFSGGDREETLPVDILGRVPHHALVSPASPSSADEVPRGGFMPTPGPPPQCVGDGDHPAWARDTHHLIGHGPGICHVLEDVGRIGDVEGPRRKRQCGPTRLYGPRARRSAMQSHLTRIRIYSHVRRPTLTEGISEVARATPHVEEKGSGERMECRYLPSRIRGQLPVEAIGVGLLREERGEEPHRAAPGRLERRRHLTRGKPLGAFEAREGRRRGGHLLTLPQDHASTRESWRTYGEPVHIVVLNWRDTANPEGGGSEVYIEKLARRWARDGHRVTLVCASHRGAPALEVRDGVRFVRVGSKLTVYSRARSLLRQGALGSVDVVVDTQNGIPFFARYATPTPTVILVHHVHREQWPVVYDPLRAKVGWFVESVASPRAFRGSHYVAVSDATRRELIQQGVDPDSITVVHNGAEEVSPSGLPPDPTPRVLVLGRLVPHKRVEHVIVAASLLRTAHPGLSIAVVGSGWWSDQLRAAAAAHGVDDIVEFTGQVSEEEKARQIDRAWVLALPSLKEGWGLVVMEAATRGVPAIAYSDAGGVCESIVDGVTGRLVHGGEQEFTAALDALLRDHRVRHRLGDQARQRSSEFSWDASAKKFAAVLTQAATEPRSARTSWWSRIRRRGHPR